MAVDKFDGRKGELFSKAVRAGKRTYFFDVKETRNKDQYLTITESKKTVNDDRVSYEKHKIFLYKEDFEKFLIGFQDACEYINNPEGADQEPQKIASDFNFEDLDS